MPSLKLQWTNLFLLKLCRHSLPCACTGILEEVTLSEDRTWKEGSVQFGLAEYHKSVAVYTSADTAIGKHGWCDCGYILCMRNSFQKENHQRRAC